MKRDCRRHSPGSSAAAEHVNPEVALPTADASVARGIRTAQAGVLINALLAVTKLVAGVIGNSYALIADAV